MGVVTEEVEGTNGVLKPEVIVKQIVEQTVPPQAYIRVERKVSAGSAGRVGGNLKQYESASVSCSWPFSVIEDDTDQENRSRALAAENMATAIVLSALGLDMTIEETEAGARIVEANIVNIKNVMPGSTVERQEPQTGVGPKPPHDPVPLRKPKKDLTDEQKAQVEANEEWARRRFKDHPEEFFDNRPRKAKGEVKSNAPDIKHKATEIPVWSL